MLYKVKALNTTGVNGVVSLSNGKQVETTHPLQTGNGFNPEELVAIAWGTCLNETIQTLLRARGLDNISHVEVAVQLKREESGIGFYFQVDAVVTIDGMLVDNMKAIVASAHQRCPVSKLIQAAKTIRLFVENDGQLYHI